VCWRTFAGAAVCRRSVCGWSVRHYPGRVASRIRATIAAPNPPGVLHIRYTGGMDNPTQNGGTGQPVLTVTINIGNDAVADSADALQVLEHAVRRINDGDMVGDIVFGRRGTRRVWPVRDVNGNTVGEIVAEDPGAPFGVMP